MQTLTAEEATAAAWAASLAAYNGGAKVAVDWAAGLGGVERLAAFVRRASPPVAEAIYLHGTEMQGGPRKAWTEIDTRLRVAIEIFRASLLSLDVLVRQGDAEMQRAAAEAMARQQRVAVMPDRGIWRRSIRQRAGMLTRVPGLVPIDTAVSAKKRPGKK